MLIKIVMNCLVDGYLGLRVRRIFHRCAWCRSPLAVCVCVLFRCRGDLLVVCFKFSLIRMLDACVRGIFVRDTTFDPFWVMTVAWVNFLVGWTLSDRRKILCIY